MTLEEAQNQIAKLQWEMAFLRQDNGEMQMSRSETCRILEMPMDGSFKQGQIAQWATLIMAELHTWRAGGRPTPPVPSPI